MAAVPAERTPPEHAAETAAKACARLEAGRGATCRREGERYVVYGSDGLVLEGRVGGQNMFNSVKVGGCDLGRFTAMLCDKAPGGLRWRDIQRVSAAEWKDGRLVLAGELRAGDEGFSLVCEVITVPGKPWFLCNLLKAANLGTKPIEVHAYYFRQYARDALDKSRLKKPKHVPNLWKAPFADAWIGGNGAWFGGFTHSPVVSMFQYFFIGESQHPDAMYKPPEPVVLAPGASCDPDGTVWIVAAGGASGGVEAWQGVLKTLEEYSW